MASPSHGTSWHGAVLERSRAQQSAGAAMMCVLWPGYFLRTSFL